MNVLKSLNNIPLSILAVTALSLPALAQTVTVQPQGTIYLNSQGGSVSQDLTVTSDVAYTASTSNPAVWLSIDPASGTAGTRVVRLTANPSGLPAGTQSDFTFVRFTFTGGSVSVPVQFNVTSSGGNPAGSALSAMPTSLTFNFQPGSTTASKQTVVVSTSSGSVSSFNVTTATDNGGNWISVNPASSTLTPSSPASLDVSVSPANLAAGTYRANIALNPPGTTGITIPVLVNVAGPSALTVNPARLDFEYQLGTTPGPAPQILSVNSVSGAQVTFSADPATTSCGSNWLVLNPRGNTPTPAGVTVQINTLQINSQGITPGTRCTGTITVSAPFATNPTQVIPVSLLVTNTPLIQAPAVGPIFNFQIGGSTTIPAQNIQITSSGTEFSYTVTATPITGGIHFLTIAQPSGTSGQPVALTINPSVLSGLAPGTYIENVTITSAGAGNSPKVIPVTLVVSNNAVLLSSLPSLTFNYQIGRTPPSSKILTLSSSGTPLNYVVTSTSTNCGAFLIAGPNGVTLGAQGSSGQLVVSVNTTGITTPVSCTGKIILTVPGSSAAALEIPVTLNASTTPLLNVDPQGISVTALAGSTAITQQIVSLTSTDFSTALNFSAVAATTPQGLTWLSVAPNSGSTPSNLSVIINPVNLPVGVYNGSILISSTSTNVPSQTVPVTLTVVSAYITAAPASLDFSQALNGPQPATQTIQISGLAAGTTIGASATTFTGSGWLTATAGSTLGTVTVSANAGQLSQGVYQGLVTILAPGANPSPLYVPVTLTVGSPQRLVLASQNVTFNFQAGAATLPDSQLIQLTSTGGNVPFTTAFTSAGGGAFLTVIPANGTTPGPIQVALNPTVVRTLGPGTYTGAITVASANIPGGTQTINVNLTIAPQGPPAVAAIVNAASSTPGAISPGEIISIYGTGIGPNVAAVFQLSATNTVAATLSNTTVTFDGIAAPLLYVSPGQINAIVPYEIANRSSVTMIIQGPGGSSSPIQLRVAETSPAIFSISQTGSGQGAILNQNASVNGTASPAPKGSIVAIYATGEGTLSPGAATGSVTSSTGPTFPKAVAAVSVTIGGVPAEILYAGEAPGLISGVLQVNARIPLDAPSGNLPVVLKVGSNSSLPNITVAVQ